MGYKDAIKKLRLKMILSQEDFAKELGVSFATVNRWEKGHFEPTYKARRALAPYFKKYGIQIDE